MWEASIDESSGNGNAIADPGFDYDRSWIELFASRSDVADGEVTMDSVNQWRRILGLPLQGTNNPNRQGYAMRYPREAALAFRSSKVADRGASTQTM